MTISVGGSTEKLAHVYSYKELVDMVNNSDPRIDLEHAEVRAFPCLYF